MPARDLLWPRLADEHYLPLLYVAAQRLPGDDVSFFNDAIEGGSISMTGVRIG